MIHKRMFLLSATLALTCLAASLPVNAQVITLAAGLKSPAKIIITDGGNLIVAEAGTGHNDGRVSLVDRCGQRRTLLDGLPSGAAPPEGGPSGPAGLALRERTLFVAIGTGDATVNGPFPGAEAPNPKGPSSPIFSSVLTAEFGAGIDNPAADVTLTLADHAALKAGATFTRQSAQGDTVSVKLLADFPDFAPDPFVVARAANLFALALDGTTLYVANAGLNLISTVNTETGATATFTGFAPLPNPLPFGPPVIDTVPDGLRVYNDQLLVTFLTGFPFPSGKAEVRSVALSTRSAATFIGGLTTAIDVLPVKTRYGGDQFFVLEISSDLSNGAPGRLLRFDAPGSAPVVIAGGLIGPVGLARDAKSGDLFITENFTGRVMQIRGTEFDVCLQDDRTNDVLRFNSLTGDYLFISCRAGLTLAGRGRISRDGCVVQLSSARVVAALDRCSISPLNRGSATIKRTFFGAAIFINDSDTTNNTCTGR